MATNSALVLCLIVVLVGQLAECGRSNSGGSKGGSPKGSPKGSVASTSKQASSSRDPSAEAAFLNTYVRDAGLNGESPTPAFVWFLDEAAGLTPEGVDAERLSRLARALVMAADEECEDAQVDALLEVRQAITSPDEPLRVYAERQLAVCADQYRARWPQMIERIVGKLGYNLFELVDLVALRHGLMLDSSLGKRKRKSPGSITISDAGSDTDRLASLSDFESNAGSDVADWEGSDVDLGDIAAAVTAADDDDDEDEESGPKGRFSEDRLPASQAQRTALLALIPDNLAGDESLRALALAINQVFNRRQEALQVQRELDIKAQLYHQVSPARHEFQRDQERQRKRLLEATTRAGGAADRGKQPAGAAVTPAPRDAGRREQLKRFFNDLLAGPCAVLSAKLASLVWHLERLSGPGAGQGALEQLRAKDRNLDYQLQVARVCRLIGDHKLRLWALLDKMV